jgi:hypothetical protein
MPPASRFLKYSSPLLLKTLSISAFPGKTSATNSFSPASLGQVSDGASRYFQCVCPGIRQSLRMRPRRCLAVPRRNVRHRRYDRTSLVKDRHQRNMSDEIDVHKECLFALRKGTFCAMETAIRRLRAQPSDRREHVSTVVRPQRSYFDAAAIAQRLDCRVFRGIQHCRTRLCCSINDSAA